MSPFRQCGSYAVVVDDVVDDDVVDDDVDDDDVCDNFFQELLDKESLSPTLDIGCEQLHLQSSIFTQIHKYIWMTWPKCVAEMQMGLKKSCC